LADPWVFCFHAPADNESLRATKSDPHRLQTQVVGLPP
jgi:hypothetical protein